MLNIIKQLQIKEKLLRLEKYIQEDQGQRGIKQFISEENVLGEAALQLITKNNLSILTGFPCMIDKQPPSETDGPLGAMAIAKTFLKINEKNKVSILTDFSSQNIFESLIQESKLNINLKAFPKQFDSLELKIINKETDIYLAIERAGPNYLGKYKTMRNKDMEDHISPIDQILKLKENKAFIAIGDGISIIVLCNLQGGNELGMGNIFEKVKNSSIAFGSEIGCVVPSDYCLICSVSNWGGYALSLAMLLQLDIHTKQLDEFVMSEHEHQLYIENLVKNGVRDGLSGKLEYSIDGLPFTFHQQLWQQLKNIYLQ